MISNMLTEEKSYCQIGNSFFLILINFEFVWEDLVGDLVAGETVAGRRNEISGRVVHKKRL